MYLASFSKEMKAKYRMVSTFKDYTFNWEDQTNICEKAVQKSGQDLWLWSQTVWFYISATQGVCDFKQDV